MNRLVIKNEEMTYNEYLERVKPYRNENGDINDAVYYKVKITEMPEFGVHEFDRRVNISEVLFGKNGSVHRVIKCIFSIKK